MEMYLEVANSILPLLNTIDDGFNHIKQQLYELRFEEAFSLSQDILLGILSIEVAIETVEFKIAKLRVNRVAKTNQDLNQYLGEFVSLFNSNKYKEIDNIVSLVYRAFIDWREAIEETIKLSIYS